MRAPQALSELLARFTADRDALIASVQACQSRMADLAARLDANDEADKARQSTTDGTIRMPRPLASEEVADLRRAVGEMRTTIAQLAAEVAPRGPEPSPVADEALAAAREAASNASQALRVAEELRASGLGTPAGDVSGVQAGIEGIQAEVGGVQAQIEVVQAEFGGLQAQIDTVRSTVGDAQVGIEAVRAETDGTRARLEAVASEVAAVQSWIEAMRAETEEARAQGTQVRSATEELQRTVEQLRKDQQRLEESMESHLDAIVAKASGAEAEDVSWVRRRLDDLQGDIRRAVEAIAAVTDLRHEVSALRGEIAGIDVAIGDRLRDQLLGDVEQVRRKLEDAIEDRLQEVTGVQPHEVGAAEGLAELQRGFEDLRTQIGSAQSAFEDRLDARLRTATSRWDEEADRLRADVNDLAHRLDRHADAHERASLAGWVDWADETVRGLSVWGWVPKPTLPMPSWLRTASAAPLKLVRS